MSLKSGLQFCLLAAAATAAAILGELPLCPDDSDLIEDPVPDIGLADEPIVEYADDIGIDE